jgi:hypothetical protein
VSMQRALALAVELAERRVSAATRA